MCEIKYVVVCKKGYCFAVNKDDVIDFIKKHGTNIAYYIGYFSPVPAFSYINTNIEELRWLDE